MPVAAPGVAPPSFTDVPIGRSSLIWATFWASLLVCAIVLAYLPGLPGTFLFDDYANLPLLGAFGGVNDWQSLLLYATSGIADPTGRPVSQLSFLLDARDWPAEPLPFKRTNICIHACNAMLLAWGLYRLGLRTGLAGRNCLGVALFAAAIWALHPLHVSTVLYIVQRHAQLAMLFFLITAIALDLAVSAFNRQRMTKGSLLVAVAVCSWLLALLSKSNAILIPLLLALISLHVARAGNARISPLDSVPRWAKWLFFGCATLSVGALVAISVASVMEPGSARTWEYWDRVLTQPRALLDYLGLILIPRIGSPGIFTDGYPLSTGLMTPPTTSLALGALLVLVGYAAWQFGKQSLALAVAFFLVGHLLESGFVNLELFYEHRNYLPSALLFWALARLLVTPDGLMPARRLMAALPVVVLLLTLTALRASGWTSPLQLAAVSERYAAGSERLELLLTSTALRQGRPDIAAERARTALRSLPSSALLAYNQLIAECDMGKPTGEALEAAQRALRNTTYWDRNLYQWISERVEASRTAPCPHNQTSSLLALAASLQASPVVSSNADAAQDVLALQGEIALVEARHSEAGELFADALATLPRIDAALWLAQRARRLGGEEIAALLFAAANNCLPPPSMPPPGMARIHAQLLEHLGLAEAARNELELSLSNLPKPKPEELAATCTSLAAGRRTDTRTQRPPPADAPAER